MTPTAARPDRPEARCRLIRQDDAARLVIDGTWRMDVPTPDPAPLCDDLSREPRPKSLTFDTTGLVAWDSRFLVFCRVLSAQAGRLGMALDVSGLPPGAARLLLLAEKVPPRSGSGKTEVGESFLERMGDLGLGVYGAINSLCAFLGEVSLATARLFRGKAVFQASNLLGLIRQAGIEALPIVSLISFLVGLILAFVGAIQLSNFGAEIFVSTLVGIAMVRVMGAIMTGIIMAGRTGAAYAAELGTMQVNEEIDALRTFGFSPAEFLVLPRMLALVLMMPLLCVYADLMGIMGGFVVGVFMLGISPALYLTHTWQSVPLANFWIGLVHATVFGVLVALSGCYRGMRCGRSAMAVGQATTSSVVTSILFIVIATAIITVICNILGV